MLPNFAFKAHTTHLCMNTINECFVARAKIFFLFLPGQYVSPIENHILLSKQKSQQKNEETKKKQKLNTWKAPIEHPDSLSLFSRACIGFFKIYYIVHFFVDRWLILSCYCAAWCCFVYFFCCLLCSLISFACAVFFFFSFPLMLFIDFTR